MKKMDFCKDLDFIGNTETERTSNWDGKSREGRKIESPFLNVIISISHFVFLLSCIRLDKIFKDQLSRNPANVMEQGLAMRVGAGKYDENDDADDDDDDDEDDDDEYDDDSGGGDDDDCWCLIYFPPYASVMSSLYFFFVLMGYWGD